MQSKLLTWQLPCPWLGRFSLVCWVAFATGGLLINSRVCTAAGTQDPFGDNSGDNSDTELVPNAASSTTDLQKKNTNEPSLPDTKHPLVLEIRSNPPKTAGDFARAILYLSRLSQWSDIQALLQKRMGTTLDEAQAVAMVQEVGVETWMKLRLRSELFTEDERQWMARILELAAEHERNPQLLQRHLQALRSTDLASQKRGLFGLQSAGSIGLAALVNDTLKNSVPPPQAMSTALHSFGASGVDALSAAWNSEDPIARQRLAMLMAPLAKQRKNLPIISAIYSTTDSNQTKQLALQSIASSPSAAEVSKYLHQRMLQEVAELTRARSNPFPASREVWSLDASQKLVVKLATEVEWSLQRVGETARCLLRQADRSSLQTADAIAATLESHYRASPTIFTNDPLGWLQSSWQSNLTETPSLLCAAWEQAVQHDLPGAQLRLVQQFGEFAKAPETVDSQVLRVLADGAKSSHPAVRMMAASSLAPALLQKNIQGGHRTLEVLMEMLRMEGRPLALVIGQNDGLRDHFTQLVAQLGIATESVRNGREALKWIQQPNPVELVFVLDRQSDLTLMQLLQRLRAHPRTKSIPIALLAEALTNGEEEFLSHEAGMFRSFVPQDLAAMVEVVKQCETVTPSPRLTSADRALWKADAEQFVRSVAKVEDHHLDLNKYNSIIVRHMPGSLLVDLSAAELIAMGSHDGQLELAHRATKAGGDHAVRREAAKSLEASLSQAGNRLTIYEIQEIYDVYNAEGPNDLQVREYLGHLLDAFESLRQP